VIFRCCNWDLASVNKDFQFGIENQAFGIAYGATENARPDIARPSKLCMGTHIARLDNSAPD